MNILYLHGFRGNKTLMKYQTKKLRDLLPTCTHHVINAVHQATEPPEDPVVRKSFQPPFYEHCQFTYLPNNQVEYRGIDQSITYLKQYVKRHKIDGIVAFSQGTYVASILSSYVPLKFLVSICGMRCKDESYSIDPELPTFHVVGKQDKWYKPGLEFSEMFFDAKVAEHKGGHHFPAESKIINDVAEWIETV
jgi:hypothetical protein